MSKYCVDCKHSYTSSTITSLTWCRRPTLGLDIVSGQQRIRLAMIERQSTDNSTCGESGKYFEQKELKLEINKKGFIQWLTNVFS